MQISFNQLSIAKIIELSKHIKEKCINLSSFEEVAQELMEIFYSSCVIEDGRSPYVLVRFFKSCAYDKLPDDIRDYIHNKESKGDFISGSKYLTLLGSYGELDNWRNRNLSQNYKAFPIHDEHMLDKFPMLSAVFDQIGLNLSHLKQSDKSILINDYHKQYGVFCVENAEGSKLIPKQAEFVKPYSVKSVFGFGGLYSTSNVYAVLVFSRERFSRKDAQLFLSLNPAIKQVTLAHEITGNIFKTDRKDTNSSVNGICDEIPMVQRKSQNKTISQQHKDIIEKEMALTSRIELEMSNEYLLQMSEALQKSHEQLEDKVRERTRELNESKGQIQLLLDSTGEAIYGLDKGGNCTFANVACLRILGYKEVGQLIGKNMHDLIHHTRKDGTPYPKEECCIYQAFREGKGTHIDDEVLWRADGTCFPVEYMSYPICKDNKTIGSVVTFSDIRERKRKDTELLMLKESLEQRVIERTELLRESKERFRSLVENTTDWIWEVNEHTQYIYASPQVRELLGYEPDEVIGMTPFDLMMSEEQERIREQFVEIAGRQEPFSGLENVNLHKDGHTVILETSGVPIFDSDGSFKGYRGIDRDITERKKVEEELKNAKENAEAASLAKSQFLANMSHEIRTPMNGVIGMTGLLMDTTLTEEQREFADTICNSADSLLTLINDILDFSKIEAGKLEMENIDFDLCGVVESSIDIFTIKANEKKLDFACFVDPEIPYMLRGDPGRLKQVLVNLTSNAIKFTMEGEVSISVILVEEMDSHATVHFAVRDTGTGISADKIDSMFQPFSQVDASTTRKYGGTGLGLAICKQIVDLMGGKIGVESENGKGSTFWFTTTMEKQPLNQEQASFEHGNIDNMRALIVDSNNTSRQIFRTYLNSLNCRVEEATSVEDIIDKLKISVDEGDPFKIALIDFFTLKSDVEGLGQTVKADPQLRDLHLIVLTSVGERGDARYFKNLGFDAYLVKPIKQAQLQDCLRIVTGKHANFREDTSSRIVTRYSITEDNKLRVRILVAEDNIVNQKIALRILDKKLGYHADLVANGKEALESLKSLDYDLVLMDCQMPEMDGYEATRAIRDNSSSVRNPGIPIIAMTANAMKGDREKCIEVGMDDYIAKPINVKELADVIDRNIVKNG